MKITMVHFVVVGILCLGTTAGAEPEERGLTAELVGRIESYVQCMMGKDRVPGLALAIVDSESILYMKGFGESCRGGSPVDSKTGFVLGSMSKSFTALAVMQLVEAGKLDLEAPVRQYIPWFRVADERVSDRITARHLLHHTSGIPGRAAAGDDASLEEHVRVLAGASLIGEPGERHRYASPNYQVLGLLVEKLSGESFGDYIQNHVFAPLGMKNSRTAPPEKPDDLSMACGHRYWFGFPVAARLPHESGRLPAAALISSVEDLARYLKALLNHGQGETEAVLSPEGVEQLFAPGVEAKGFSYAMGWRSGAIKGVSVLHHGGHLYHFRGKMIMLPQENKGVVVLTNASCMFGRTTSHLIANGIVALLVGKQPGIPGLALTWVLTGFGLVMVLLTFGLLKEALTLKKWREQVGDRQRKTGWKKWKVWLSLAWGLALPPTLLIGLPLFLQLSWPQMLRAVPDLSWWMLLYLPAGFLVGLVKVRTVIMVGRNGKAVKEKESS